MNLTKLQRTIFEALSSRPLSNAQVAAAANCSEGYASKTLHKLARARLAVSRYVEDAEDPNTHFRVWKRA